MNAVVKKSLISTGILAALIYVILQLFDFPNLTHQAGHTHDPCNGCQKVGYSYADKHYFYHNIVTGKTMIALNTNSRVISPEKMRFDWFILNRYCAIESTVKIPELGGITIDLAYDLCERPLFGTCHDCHDHQTFDLPSVINLPTQRNSSSLVGKITTPHLFRDIYKDQQEWGLLLKPGGHFVYFINNNNISLNSGDEVSYKLVTLEVPYDKETFSFELAYDIAAK